MLLPPCELLAKEKINILTTTTDLASITSSITGELAQVESIASGLEDPHFLTSRPSFIIKARDADVWIRIGMDLEVGWEPVILRDSRNRRIQEGAPGHIDCSENIIRQDVPEGKVTRDMGDVHAHGNPHYWLDPLNGRIVAKTIADRLSTLFPDRKEEFKANLKTFERRLDEKMFGFGLVDHYGGARLWQMLLENTLAATLQEEPKEQEVSGWYAMMLAYMGQPLITYHKSWIYPTRRFGLETVIELEPKPGIPPSSRHLARVVQIAQNRTVRVILQEPFYSRKAADFIARHSGLSVVVSPNTVGGGKEVNSYLELIDYVINNLQKGLSGS